MNPFAMQVRCINCLGEQYGPAVYDFSQGLVSCRCGYRPRLMTDDEYRSALYLARLKASDDE